MANTPYMNAGRHTCIVYEETPKRVLAVAMDSPELVILNVNAEKFHEEWKPIQGCEGSRAAQSYLNTNMTIPSNIQKILERIVKMEDIKEVTTAPIAKEKKAAKPPVKAPAKKDAKAPAKGAAKSAPAKGAATSKKPRLSGDTVIKLTKGAADKKFNEGSLRGMVFAKIKDGMTVDALVKACKGFADEKVVMGNVVALSNPAQPHPGITLK